MTTQDSSKVTVWYKDIHEYITTSFKIKTKTKPTRHIHKECITKDFLWEEVGFVWTTNGILAEFSSTDFYTCFIFFLMDESVNIFKRRMQNTQSKF